VSNRLDVDKEQLRSSIGEHFRVPEIRTLLAHVASSDPIAISRVQLGPGFAECREPTSAYAIPVLLRPPSRLTISVDGTLKDVKTARPGDILLVDMRAHAWSVTNEPYSILRIQISQRTFEDLAYDRGEKVPNALRTLVCKHDAVLHELSNALISWIDVYGPGDCLFADHVALAFHSHIIRTYGNTHDGRQLRGGLAAWQLRRARDIMLANLAGNVTLTELASACGLSVTYFSRAFRQTTGIPPHKWLMSERIRQAKNLLLNMEMPAAEIAVACGFTDQSHFTRVFSQLEGKSPARWRRSRLDDTRRYWPRGN